MQQSNCIVYFNRNPEYISSPSEKQSEDHNSIQEDNSKPQSKYFEIIEKKLKNNNNCKERKNIPEIEEKNQKINPSFTEIINEENEYLIFGFLRNIGTKNTKKMHLEFLPKIEKDILKYKFNKKKPVAVKNQNFKKPNALKINCENINKESSLKPVPIQNTPIITVNKLPNDLASTAPSKVHLIQSNTYEMMKYSFHNPKQGITKSLADSPEYFQKQSSKKVSPFTNCRNIDIFGHTQDPQGESELLKSQKTGYFKSIQSSNISEDSKNDADEHSTKNRNRNIDNKFQGITTIESQAMSSFQQKFENPKIIQHPIEENEKSKPNEIIKPEVKKDAIPLVLLGSRFQIQKENFQRKNLLKLGNSTGNNMLQNVNKESSINDNSKLNKNIKSFKSRGSLDFENISVIESNSKNVMDFPIPSHSKLKDKEQKHENSFESDLSAYNSNPKDGKKDDILVYF